MGVGLPPLFVWSATGEGFLLFFICTLELLKENSGTEQTLSLLSFLFAGDKRRLQS